MIRPIIADGVGYSNSGRKYALKYSDCQIFKSNIILLLRLTNTLCHPEKHQEIFLFEILKVWIDTPLEVCKNVKGLLIKPREVL